MQANSLPVNADMNLSIVLISVLMVLSVVKINVASLSLVISIVCLYRVDCFASKSEVRARVPELVGKVTLLNALGLFCATYLIKYVHVSVFTSFFIRNPMLYGLVEFLDFIKILNPEL